MRKTSSYKNNPLISVIIPFHNSERSIERCVKSVLKQSYKEFELILVDDGSTDSSKKLCQNLKEKDGRIVLLSKKNGGVSSARNLGLRESNGEYVCFIDSDDYVSSHYLSSLLVLAQDGVMPLCGINCVTKLRVFKMTIDKDRELSLPSFDTIKVLKNCELLNAPVNKLYQRRLIDFSFDEGFDVGEDLLFNLRYLNKIHSVKAIKKCLYFYDRTSASTTRSFRINALEELAKLWMLSTRISNNQFTGFDPTYFKNIYFREIDATLVGLPRVGKRSIDKDLVKKWLNGSFFTQSLSFFNEHEERYRNPEKMSLWILDSKERVENTLRNRIKKLLMRIVSRNK